MGQPVLPPRRTRRRRSRHGRPPPLRGGPPRQSGVGGAARATLLVVRSELLTRPVQVLCFKQLGWSGLAEAWTARLAGVAGDLQEAAAATEPAPSLAASLADAVDDALQRVDTFRAEGMPSAV